MVTILAFIACSAIHLLYSQHLVEAGVLKQEEDPVKNGLYDPDDKVEILIKDNFKSHLYNKNHAWVIQFYNSYCGHCRRFAPLYKELASQMINWKHSIKLGVIDCSDDKNNDVCREFEILGYPTLRYFHENYVEGKNNFGENLQKFESVGEMKQSIVTKMQQEQTDGRGENWPNILPMKYDNIAEAWADLPPHIKIVFLIFEVDNSTTGSEVILDLDTVFGIKVRTVSSSSILSKSLGLTNFPNLVAVGRDTQTTALTPKESTRYSLRKAILVYLQSKSISVPEKIFEDNVDDTDDDSGSYINQNDSQNSSKQIADIVYQADLETGLRYMLGHELTSRKTITGEKLVALQDLLQVLLKFFPFTANGKLFMSQLYEDVLKVNSLEGRDLAIKIKNLEDTYAPVYSTLAEYIGCKGSNPKYRGYTCSLWTIFHTLTVNAVRQHSTDATQVLRAMHGYVKHFFGCSECSQHFQAMAKKNNLSGVAENDGAILWLWVAHNTVNHRLAGDQTEDPKFPKRQYPIIENCPKCHQSNGMWDLQEVLHYLKTIYDVKNVDLTGAVPHSLQSSPFSKLDMTLIIMLYVCCAVMLVFVLKLFLNKKFYRKKTYAHDATGKV